MLTHIRPSLRRFTCKYRSIFNGVVYPGSMSRTIQDPPRAQSPFARWRRYLHRRAVQRTTSEGVTPPSSLLRTHAPHQNPPVLFVYLIRRVLAGCCQSLLGDGPSRRYLCNPCTGAWTLTPGCLSGAFIRFFPGVTASPPLHQVRHIQQPPQCHFNDDPILGAAVIPLCSGSHAR
jgi:hypothetical protein